MISLRAGFVLFSTVLFLGGRVGAVAVNSIDVEGKPTYSEEQLMEPETEAYPFSRLPVLSAIRAYQIILSPTKGSSCPMHPHCSLYGYQAFASNNPVKAFLMTADRLHRCGHDLQNYVAIEHGEMVRFYDPVDVDSTYEVQKISHEKRRKIYLDDDESILSVETGEGNGGSSEEKRLFRFAGSLYSNGRHLQANTEYRRLLSYFPGTRYSNEAIRGIFFCYYSDGEYLEAIHWGLDSLAVIEASPFEHEIKFYIGASYYKLKNYNLAADYLDEVSNMDDPDFAVKSLLLRGLSLAHNSEWQEAESYFARIDESSQRWSSAQQNIKLCREGEELEYKSPWIAGVLSIIPGAGYLYAGYKQSALASLIVNGLFIYGTYQSFENGNDGLGTILGVVSFGWYSGNIYGSVISAKRQNMKMDMDLLLRFDLGYSF